MRIPITMCHGTNRGPYFTPKPRWRERPPLDASHFDGLIRIAAELGFRSISYDELAGWRTIDASLPDRPILFDFDHPNISIHRELWPIMREHGYRGNIFINTGAMEKVGDPRYMTWDDLGDLLLDGWQVGSHMHHHVSLAYLARKDPSGRLIREEMDLCDRVLRDRLGVIAKDFAYTTTTWSAIAEGEVKKRYRFGRLWIIGTHLDTEAGSVRYAQLAGVPDADDGDGGPPFAARYITRETHPYRLPSMDFEYLIHDYEAFRRYLEGALGDEEASSGVPA